MTAPADTIIRRPVPAVGTACFRGDDVLLIRRGTKPLAGDWSIPGGRLEFGERTAEGALRELHEETGITARLVGLVDVVDAIFTSRQSGETHRHYVLFDYAAVWEANHHCRPYSRSGRLKNRLTLPHVIYVLSPKSYLRRRL